MIDPGQYNHYIALQSYVETRSASGHVTKTYTTYASVWAKFRTLSGYEKLMAQQVAATLSHEVSILYRSDVQADHRIVWDSRIFDIKDVRNVDEQNIEIRMLCIEVITQGPAASPSPSSSGSSSPSTSISGSPSSSVSSSASSSISASVSASASEGTPSASISASPSASISASVSSSPSSAI